MSSPLPPASPLSTTLTEPRNTDGAPVPSRPYTIVPVRNGVDMDAAIVLIREYVAWLGLDLSYQSFDEEMASMPGKYAPPAGELWLARHATDGTPLACVGLRPLPEPATAGLCEVKRLYVSPQARGMGLGRAMVDCVVAHARKLGYREMRLDTLTTMTAARRLYQAAGFVEIPAYYDTPVENTCFMAKSL